MKKIARFEDLEIWQEARAFAGDVYRASNETTLNSVLAKAETCARRIGRLRVIMEDRANKPKASLSTRHAAPSTN